MFRVNSTLLLVLALVSAAAIWHFQFRDTETAPGTDVPYEVKQDFKLFALKYYDISLFQYKSDEEIWIRLNSSAPSEQVDMERLASQIGTAYKERTGIRKIVTVAVLHPIEYRLMTKVRI